MLVWRSLEGVYESFEVIIVTLAPKQHITRNNVKVYIIGNYPREQGCPLCPGVVGTPA